MQYTNEMNIKFKKKVFAETAMPVITDALSNEEFFKDYERTTFESVIADLHVEKDSIVLGSELDGYFLPEDARNIFESILVKLASTLTLLDFEAEVRSIGDYSSNIVTATFKTGNFNLRNEYWDNCEEDGESEVREINQYFF